MAKRERKTGDGLTWVEVEPAVVVTVEATESDELDRDPTPDPEWLAGLPPQLREAHDRMEKARISLRVAEQHKQRTLQEARSVRDREIAQAREYMHLEIERATEQYNSTASRCDAEYGKKKQAAQEQYDQAQMQYAQSLQRWQDTQTRYVAAVQNGKEG
jgi:hypothetical protein